MRCGRPVRSVRICADGKGGDVRGRLSSHVGLCPSIRFAWPQGAPSRWRGRCEEPLLGAGHDRAIRFTALPALSVWVGMPVRAGGRKVPSHFGWALRGAEPVSRPAVPARFSPSPARRCFPKCFFRFGTDVRRSAVSSDGTFFRWDDVPEREPACRKGPQGNNLRMRACMRASPQRLSGVSP